jgi:TolA-binding protein
MNILKQKPMDNTARIDRYLTGAMDAAEREAFEADVTADAQLAEDLALQRDMAVFLRRREHRSALQAQLKDMGRAHFQPEKKEAKTASMSRRRILWVGAMAAAAGLALFLLRPLLFPPSLYDQYAKYPALALAEKSSAGPVDWSAAETAFNSGNYAAAETPLEQYLAVYPADMQAQLYLGICKMELDKHAEARQIFDRLIQEAESFRDYAQWYSALSYLKAGDTTACRRALNDIPAASLFYKKARELAGRL